MGRRRRSDLAVAVALAVAKAGRQSSDSTPNLGTAICRRCSPKKDKKKKTKKPPLKVLFPITWISMTSASSHCPREVPSRADPKPAVPDSLLPSRVFPGAELQLRPRKSNLNSEAGRRERRAPLQPAVHAHRATLSCPGHAGLQTLYLSLQTLSSRRTWS